MDLEEEVLRMIVPPPEAVASIQERADRLKAVVEDYVASHGIDAEVRFAGSFSKGTFLSDPDIDLFLVFPDDVSAEDMKRIGLKAGEDILHGERMFSDHPYTRGVFEGLEVDMVPCFGVDSPEHMRSAVDRTPFHTRYILSHLDPAGRDQVRLLKRFMKGIGTYGAEQDSRGFSGYLCEVLVVRYGSFRGVLEAAAKWKPGTVVAVEGRGPKMVAPLVVHDPVDPKRNAASAVHLDTLSLFIVAAREYLREPRMEFFFPPEAVPASRGELAAAAEERGCRVLAVTFARPDGVEDSLYSQLWRTQVALGKLLLRGSFPVIRAVHSMDGDRMAVAFELETDTLPGTRMHRGPPVWVDTDSFMEKWRGNPHGEPFILAGAWTVVADRQYTDAAEMVRAEVGRAGIGKGLDPGTAEVLSHDDAIGLADPMLLTDLLLPRMPWESRN